MSFCVYIEKSNSETRVNGFVILDFCDTYMNKIPYSSSPIAAIHLPPCCLRVRLRLELRFLFFEVRRVFVFERLCFLP